MPRPALRTSASAISARAAAGPGRRPPGVRLGSACAMLLLLSASPAAGGTQAADAADIEAGRAAFGPCRACHSVEKGKHGLGPSMHGVVGRQVAAVDGFAFSSALREQGGVWTPERLDAFLLAPRKAVPGTSMTFAGIKDPARRAALISYLASLK